MKSIILVKINKHVYNWELFLKIIFDFNLYIIS